ncbi:hypothetical protein OS127_02930 [Corynebacterium sp. P6129]|uniref:hypothetical protein n=1 Tax=Corynebacterium antarcticum TaxID=2800405 RepID=UPI0022609DA2|nr:hypothetical protein [Corynebacterium antarcticum]MCX7491483.1 hypothetical protein [Corynebacterium antarcticum]
MTQLHGDFRRDVEHLKSLYATLDEAKHAANMRDPDAPTTHAPPGPRMPGQGWAVILDADMTERLHEVTAEAAATIQPGRGFHQDAEELCDWLAFNAHPCTELDWYPDLHDEIATQIHQLEHALGTHEGQRPEGRVSSLTVSYRMTQYGHDVTPKYLSKLADRGHISRHKTPSGKNTYLMSEVIAHLRKHCP